MYLQYRLDNFPAFKAGLTDSPRESSAVELGDYAWAIRLERVYHVQDADSTEYDDELQAPAEALGFYVR